MSDENAFSCEAPFPSGENSTTSNEFVLAYSYVAVLRVLIVVVRIFIFEIQWKRYYGTQVEDGCESRSPGGSSDGARERLKKQMRLKHSETKAKLVVVVLLASAAFAQPQAHTS